MSQLNKANKVIKSELARKSAFALIVKVIGAISSLFVFMLLGRYFGPAGVGLFSVALSIVIIVSTLGRYGIDNYLLRETAAALSVNDYLSVNVLVKSSCQVVFLLSSLLSVVMYGLSGFVSLYFLKQPASIQLLQVMSFAIVPVALYNVSFQLLQAQKRNVEAMLVLMVWPQVFLLFGIYAVRNSSSTTSVACSYLVSAIVCVVISFLYLRKNLNFLSILKAESAPRKLLREATPFFLATIAQISIAWSTPLISSFWVSATDVGAFSASHRIAMLVNFIFVAVNGIASVRFATHHKKDERQELVKSANSASLLMLLVGVPLCAIIFIFNTNLLSLFGSDFRDGKILLNILLLGQLINLLTGCVSSLLIMTGYSQLFRNIMIVSAFFHIGLTGLLCSLWGILGAAAAFSMTIAMQNIFSYFYVKNKLGFFPLPKFCLGEKI